MDPIGQTFFIDEPINSVDGVYVTKVDLFFKTKSSTLGVEVQIREVENGFPTTRIVPFGRKFLAASDVNISEDGTTETTFTFPSPVFCRSQTEYFVCILPAGGNPDYQVWAAELGQTDVASGAPIHTNSTVGALYTSSNDRVWVPILKEDIKIKIYRAKFTQTSANAYFRPADYEFFFVNNRTGSFISAEPVVLGNTEEHVAWVPVSSVSGTFANGEFVWQSNGSANTATGYLYSANSTVLKVQNTSGRFVATNTVHGNTSSATATVGTPRQNVVVTASSNSVTVPDTTIYTANDIVYLSSNSHTFTNVRKVTAIVNATTLSISSNAYFSENDAYIGHIRGNGDIANGQGLNAYFSSMTEAPASIIDPVASTIVILAYSTANATVNFANSGGLRLIGTVSMASANVLHLINVPYDSLKENKSFVTPSGTTLAWSFKGFQYANSFPADSSPITFNPAVEYDFTDKERVMMSRSNEFSQLTGGRTGNTSYQLIASLTTNNDKVSPVVDMIANKSQFLTNLLQSNNVIEGAIVDLTSQSAAFTNYETVSQSYTVVYTSNVSGSFTLGETVYQGTNATSNFANGTVFFANSTVVKLKSVSGTMVSSPNNMVGVTSGATANVTTFSNNNPTGTVINHFAQYANTSTVKFYNISGTFTANVGVTGGTSGATANIATLQTFNEINNPYGPSRYISKNIVLAEGQDAEDVKTLLTAYRPANTSIHVYIRMLNAEDAEHMETKPWSELVCSTSDALRSSTEDLNSYVELEYDMPSSNLVLSNSVTTSTTSNNVTLSSTSGLANGNHVYLNDSSTGKFNVRAIHNIVNNTVIELKTRPSFSSSNADFGTIPNLKSCTSAFKYTANSGICRYVSNTDVVFDTYKTMAIKIVLASDNRYIVPRVADMRTIALQI